MRKKFDITPSSIKKALKKFFPKKVTKNVSLEPGDIIAFKGNSFSSWAIKMFTVSKWTHVGIMKSSNELFEVNVRNAHLKNTGQASHGGPNIISLSDMLKTKGDVHVFKRNDKLNSKEIVKLQKHIQLELQSNKNYSRLKATNSANIPVLKTWTTLFCIVLGGYATLSLGYAMYFYYNSITTPYLDLQTVWGELALDALIYAGIGVIEVLLIRFVLRTITIKLMYSKKVEEILRKLKVPETYITDPEGEFCSNAVLKADKNTDGKLSNLYYEKHEPRPKDIIKLCEQLGYEEYRMK